MCMCICVCARACVCCFVLIVCARARLRVVVRNVCMRGSPPSAGGTGPHTMYSLPRPTRSQTQTHSHTPRLRGAATRSLASGIPTIASPPDRAPSRCVFCVCIFFCFYCLRVVCATEGQCCLVDCTHTNTHKHIPPPLPSAHSLTLTHMHAHTSQGPRSVGGGGPGSAGGGGVNNIVGDILFSLSRTNTMAGSGGGGGHDRDMMGYMGPGGGGGGGGAFPLPPAAQQQQQQMVREMSPFRSASVQSRVDLDAVCVVCGGVFVGPAGCRI